MGIMTEARIPVRFRQDPETGLWHFRVADPLVVGGGQATLAEARQAAADAIAFSLEDEIEPSDDSQIEYLRVAVG
jgi:predicted RNase H-like HicB family nuclease